MNYIVDPILFYIMSTFTSLKTATGIFGGVFACGMITATVLYIYNQYELDYYKVGDYPSKDEKIEEYAQALRLCKRCMLLSIVLTIIFVSFTIFIPSKATCIEMIVAKNISAETVEGGVEALKSAVDYIIDKLQALK